VRFVILARISLAGAAAWIFFVGDWKPIVLRSATNL